MPLTIDAYDKFKAAMKAVPGSGLTALASLASRALPGEPARAYVTPAKVYQVVLDAKPKRQHIATSYAAFRAIADDFDPSDSKANAERQQGRAVTREANAIAQEDWDRLLKPGGLLDGNVEDLFGIFGDQMSVCFIRHQHDLARLKRIEILYKGCSIPQVISMHW